MDLKVFKNSATHIAQRNVSERVMRVYASFDSSSGLLQLLYCTEGDSTDEDREDCELTCGELIAEFPDIIFAETNCRPIGECNEDEASIVFSRL